jgi:hypothetical protein
MRAAPPEQRLYSCRLLDDEQRKCAYAARDKRTVERLRANDCVTAGSRERAS